jgi:hypothetical protein
MKLTRLAYTSEATMQHLGYSNCTIELPHQEHSLDWTYVGECPHSDGIFEVAFGTVKLPGEYWGRNVRWSPDGRFVALERRFSTHSELHLLDSTTGRTYFVDRNARALTMEDTELKFARYGELETMTINAIEITGLIQ